jgi:hypothetical protein
MTRKAEWNDLLALLPGAFSVSDSIDCPSKEEAYMQGMESYPNIFQVLICTPQASTRPSSSSSIFSYCKTAKVFADRAIDLMQDVQNLRKAIYPYVAVLSSIFPPPIRKRSFKLKLDTTPKGTERYRKLSTTAVNYLCVHLRFVPR